MLKVGIILCWTCSTGLPIQWYGWVKYCNDPPCEYATEDDIKKALQGLKSESEIWIRGEYCLGGKNEGFDRGYLDEVMLSPKGGGN